MSVHEIQCGSLVTKLLLHFLPRTALYYGMVWYGMVWYGILALSRDWRENLVHTSV